MKFGIPNSLMMSDSLKQKLEPSKDEDVSQFEDAFIIAAISVIDYKLIVGSLIGVSIDNQIVKLDLKVSLAESHDFIGEISEKKKIEIDLIEFHYNTVKQMIGNFYVSVARISDIDHANKMAILALDLVKII